MLRQCTCLSDNLIRKVILGKYLIPVATNNDLVERYNKTFPVYTEELKLKIASDIVASIDKYVVYQMVDKHLSSGSFDISSSGICYNNNMYSLLDKIRRMDMVDFITYAVNFIDRLGIQYVKNVKVGYGYVNIYLDIFHNVR